MSPFIFSLLAKKNSFERGIAKFSVKNTAAMIRFELEFKLIEY